MIILFRIVILVFTYKDWIKAMTVKSTEIKIDDLFIIFVQGRVRGTDIIINGQTVPDWPEFLFLKGRMFEFDEIVDIRGSTIIAKYFIVEEHLSKNKEV